MSQITYENKVALNENNDIADINKVNASDMNQIKQVVNENEATMNDMIVNEYSNSQSNTYSCDYINNMKLIKIKQFASNITVPANGTATMTLGTITTPTGYTLLGVLNKAGGFADQWQVDFTINSVGSVQTYVRSYYGTELTSEISCTVLFVKTDYLEIL